MARVDNYLVQAQQAKGIFLRFDQELLIGKCSLGFDETYLYTEMLCKLYRLNRKTGDLQRREETWVDANTHAEVMTLLDLICDSRMDRHLSGKWKNMQSFGLMFHQNLAEQKDPFAMKIQKNMEGFRRACLAMKGEAVPGADMAYAIALFEGLRICIQFWEGDEDFLPRVRYLWDENALMYLKYETMYFAVGLLRQRITEYMEKAFPFGEGGTA